MQKNQRSYNRRLSKCGITFQVRGKFNLSQKGKIRTIISEILSLTCSCIKTHGRDSSDFQYRMCRIITFNTNASVKSLIVIFKGTMSKDNFYRGSVAKDVCFI